MKTADVVIIGGGIFSTNLAYALATRGAKNILLLEKGVLAAGSSGKATGGLRHQFADELDIRFSIEGIHFYKRFIREYTPIQVCYHPPHSYQHGYMFLCTTQQSWQTMQMSVALQKELGVPTSLLNPTEVRALVPQLVVDDVIGATFCPTDGYSDPGAMVRALAHAAQAQGVTIHEHSPVREMVISKGGFRGVATTHETIFSSTVLNAPGASAALVATLAGIMNLPVWPLKRQLYQTETFDDLPQNVPMVVDLSTGFHFRRKDDGVILALPFPSAAEQIHLNQCLKPE